MNLVDKVKSKIKFSESMKNVAKISFGTMFGQLISLAAIPIFTRIYDQDVFGVWATLNSIALIVNSFSDLGLNNAIMIEENEDEIYRLYKVTSTISIGISLIVALMMGVYYWIFGNNSEMNIGFIMIYIFIAIFTLQQVQICYTWLNRNGEYNILTKNPLINNGLFGIAGILLGLIGVRQYGYFIGWICGQVITMIHMKKHIPKSMITFKRDDYLTVFKKRKRFIQYQLPSNVMSITKNQLPVLVIGALFGKKIVGSYSLSVRLLNVPVTFLATSMGRVYFKTTSEMKRNGKSIGEFTYRNIVKAMKVSIVPMIVLIAFGDLFATIIYGPKYEVAGNIIRIVALQNFFTFLLMTLFGLSVTAEKQNYSMISYICQAIGITVGLCIGKFIFNSIYIGLVLMSILFIIINVIYLCMLLKVIGVSSRKYLKHVGKSLGIILVVSLIIRILLFLIKIVPSL